MLNILEKIEEEYKKETPQFKSGDTVKIHTRIVEGKKERIQIFQGVVIAIKNDGLKKTFTVRAIRSNNVGVERIFPLHSPNISQIEVVKRGKVRKSKLYYLRGRSAKEMRIKEVKRVIPTTIKNSSENNPENSSEN